MPIKVVSVPSQTQADGSLDDEVLVDTTASLQLHSKRLDRQKKKLDKKAKKKLIGGIWTFLDLPYDVLLHILSYALPSSILNLARVNSALHRFVVENQNTIGRSVVARRYTVTARCFRAPVLLENVDPQFYPALQNTRREQLRIVLKQPYTHIMSPNPAEVCTCMTCILSWNALSLAYDFNQWQDDLDKGIAIPMPARGQRPRWNRQLLEYNGKVVSKATRSYLWYARILEAHLESTIRSITRQRKNKGNKRRRFSLSDEDIASGTDDFLAKKGPPTVDFPFSRDNYYMLESYFPNRSWNDAEKRWMYMPASQHDTDLQIIQRWFKPEEALPT